MVMLSETFVINARLARLSLLLYRERKNKLANLDVVVGAIAHEVRQPLTSITLHAGAAQRVLANIIKELRPHLQPTLDWMELYRANVHLGQLRMPPSDILHAISKKTDPKLH